MDKLYVVLILMIIIFLIVYIPSNKHFSKKHKLNDLPYVHSNFTKRMEYTLLEVLKHFSACKNNQDVNYKKLRSKNSVFYTSATLPLKEKLEMKIFINNILERINSRSIFNFHLIEIQDVNIYSDKKNKHYVANILVNDNKNYISQTLLLDVIVYSKGKNNKKKSYPIGFPSEDQLIPLPMGVEEVQRGVISTDSIDPIEPDNISHLYINFVKILNSTEVLNAYNVPKYKKLNGVSDNKIPFSRLRNCDNNPFIETAKQRNKWPRLIGEPKNRKQWPCQPAPQCWNALGVAPNPVISTKECPGERHSTEQMPLQPYYDPSLGTYPRNTGPNAWLFDLTRGIPSFPTN